MNGVSVFSETEYHQYLSGPAGEFALKVGLAYHSAILDGMAADFPAYELLAMAYLQGYMDGENNLQFAQATEGFEVGESHG